MMNEIMNGITWMADQSNMTVLQFVITYVATNTMFLAAGWQIFKMYKKMVQEEFGK